MITKESLPQLTPISTSKKAQARFATALVDLAAPAFATVTSTVHLYLSSLMAAASAFTSAFKIRLVFQLPAWAANRFKGYWQVSEAILAVYNIAHSPTYTLLSS
jgi:hypothetical protein